MKIISCCKHFLSQVCLQLTILVIISSAFVRESDDQKLNEVAPNLSALLFYLRRENGGMTIHETKSYYSHKHGRDVFEMSDGLTYAKNDESKWYIILD